MITDRSNPTNPTCTCSGADAQVEVLRDLIASGMGQVEASNLLWGSEANQAKGRIRGSFLAAFPWLRLPPWHEATP
jgi:hypothetical protein